jgi:quercetin dioxygenase-like cupin family protein
MDIIRNGSVAAVSGPDETFTGSVRVDTPFAGTDGATIMGAHVHFQPGARTAWHRHPKGQTLIVTHGVGRVQAEDGPVRAIRAGDVVWIRPNERHWHGAGDTTAMSHIAIVETSEGVSADWMEKVTDEAFLASAID